MVITTYHIVYGVVVPHMMCFLALLEVVNLATERMADGHGPSGDAWCLSALLDVPHMHL